MCLFVPDDLRVLHAHERDELLSFESERHRYRWQGQEVPKTVTGFIHNFASVFDEIEEVLNIWDSVHIIGIKAC